MCDAVKNIHFPKFFVFPFHWISKFKTVLEASSSIYCKMRLHDTILHGMISLWRCSYTRSYWTRLFCNLRSSRSTLRWFYFSNRKMFHLHRILYSIFYSERKFTHSDTLKIQFSILYSLKGFLQNNRTARYGIDGKTNKVELY